MLEAITEQIQRALSELSTEFERLKSDFSPPQKLNYHDTTSDDVVTVAVPSGLFAQVSQMPFSRDTPKASKSGDNLKSNENNKPVKEYLRNLEQLLTALDGILTRGNKSVRDQRSKIVRNVMGEIARVEHWIAAVWDHTRQEEDQPNARPSRWSEPQEVSFLDSLQLNDLRSTYYADRLSPFFLSPHTHMLPTPLFLSLHKGDPVRRLPRPLRPGRVRKQPRSDSKG